MRALALFIFLALPAAAPAAAPSAKLSSRIVSERGSTSLSREGTSAVTTLRSGVDLSSGGYFGSGTLRAGLDRTIPNYERYLVTDRSGNTRPLSAARTDPEYAARAGGDVFLPGGTVSVDGAKSFGPTPFPFYSASVAASADRYDWGARIGVTLARSDRANPLSYFVHPDTLRPTLRPPKVVENKATVFWEQVLGERWRSRLKVSGVHRPEDRPERAEAEGGLAHALSDNFALIASIGGSRERRRAERLRDERGFLEAGWLQAEVRYEPSYSWALAARAGTLLERETARGTAAARRVGTDSLGLDVRRSQGRTEFDLRAFAAFSNTGYTTYQFGGGFTWHL